MSHLFARKPLALLVVALIALGSPTGLTAEPGSQTPPLPPGHPPLGGRDAQPDIPEVRKGSGAGSQGLTWTMPSGWSKETPSSSMRRAQYRIPGSGGPAECVVFYFGPGQGGDAKANAARWAGQFKRLDGSPVTDEFKTREIKIHDMPIMMVEVAGTYVGGMGGGPSGSERPNSMLLGAIVQGPDANWFFRAIGPRATLERERAAFDKMIQSIKRGQDSL